MDSQRSLEIYVSYDSPSIIKNLEPKAEDVFTTCFANYHFDELVFPKFRGEKEKQLMKEITWNNLSYFNPCTKRCELKV